MALRNPMELQGKMPIFSDYVLVMRRYQLVQPLDDAQDSNGEEDDPLGKIWSESILLASSSRTTCGGNWVIPTIPSWV